MSEHTVTYSMETAFAALADSTRRAVLDLLKQGSLPAGHIATAFTVSRPAISKHLGVLRRAHLVRERRQGRQRIYQLDPAPLKAVEGWLSHYRAFWETNLRGLKKFVEAEHASEASQAERKRKQRKKR
jgi:DNA-binding transcriptional ArsR family regulator